MPTLKTYPDFKISEKSAVILYFPLSWFECVPPKPWVRNLISSPTVLELDVRINAAY
jgi:hypothetical protein